MILPRSVDSMVSWSSRVTSRLPRALVWALPSRARQTRSSSRSPDCLVGRSTGGDGPVSKHDRDPRLLAPVLSAVMTSSVGDVRRDSAQIWIAGWRTIGHVGGASPCSITPFASKPWRASSTCHPTNPDELLGVSLAFGADEHVAHVIERAAHSRAVADDAGDCSRGTATSRTSHLNRRAGRFGASTGQVKSSRLAIRFVAVVGEPDTTLTPRRAYVTNRCRRVLTRSCRLVRFGTVGNRQTRQAPPRDAMQVPVVDRCDKPLHDLVPGP